MSPGRLPNVIRSSRIGNSGGEPPAVVAKGARNQRPFFHPARSRWDNNLNCRLFPPLGAQWPQEIRKHARNQARPRCRSALLRRVSPGPKQQSAFAQKWRKQALLCRPGPVFGHVRAGQTKQFQGVTEEIANIPPSPLLLVTSNVDLRVGYLWRHHAGDHDALKRKRLPPGEPPLPATIAASYLPPEASSELSAAASWL